MSVELAWVANALLWAAVLVLGVLVYALSRQVRLLSNRIAPAGALAINPVLQAGEPAPQMSIESLHGGDVEVGTANQLLFFLAPDCPICQSLIPVVRAISREDRELDVVLASDGGDVAQHSEYIERHSLQTWPYLLSEELGRTYGIGKLPYAVLTDESGHIASYGLINTREHLESLFEARDRGAASVQDYLQQQQAVDAAAQPAGEARAPD